MDFGRVWAGERGQRAVLAEKPGLGLSKEETSPGAGVLNCGAGSSRHLSAPVCPDAGPGPPWSKDAKDRERLCPAQNLAELTRMGGPAPCLLKDVPSLPALPSTHGSQPGAPSQGSEGPHRPWIRDAPRP